MGVHLLRRPPGDARLAPGLLVALLLALGLVLSHGVSDGEPGPDRGVYAAGPSLPLSFEPSRGRFGPAVDYVAHANDGSVLLNGRGAALVGPDHSRPLRLLIAGASPSAPEAQRRLPGVVNDYRFGNSRRLVGIPTFGRVRYRDVYPGVDAFFHGGGGTLEYDFRLQPGADPGRIAVRFPGAHLAVAPNGDLLVRRGGATLRQRAPRAFQPTAHGRRPVASSFRVHGDRASFAVGDYDGSRPLVIDPLLLDYSTYLGGSLMDGASGIAVDRDGSAYIAGFTETIPPDEHDTPGATDYPSTPGAYQGPPTDHVRDEDAVVSKLSPSGDALEYSTYVGGPPDERANSIAVDARGAAYVVGSARFTGFPFTTTLDPVPEYAPLAFALKLSPDGGRLRYSTRLGAGEANSVAVDSSGSAYVAGETGPNTGFPEVNPVPGAFDEGSVDAFALKLNPAGDRLEYSTRLGGTHFDYGDGIAIDRTGAAYVAGITESSDYPTVRAQQPTAGGDDDVFISKLAPGGGRLDYSTYLGGSGPEAIGETETAAAGGEPVAVRPDGALLLAGTTQSADFPTASPLQGYQGEGDAFVTLLAPRGGLRWSTFLGGTGGDEGRGVALDRHGAALVTGLTDSTDFADVNARGGWAERDANGTDAFVTRLAGDGSRIAYATRIGGPDDDVGEAIVADGPREAYVAGRAGSGFPEKRSIQSYVAAEDAFVTKLSWDPSAAITGGPKPLSRERRPVFSFRPADERVRLQCSLDRSAFAPCTSPRRYGPLADGRHLFRVRAIGAAGTVGRPSRRSWRLDTKVHNPDVSARKRQFQGGAHIKVKIRGGAGEPVDGLARGTVTVRETGRRFGLARVRKRTGARRRTVYRLRPLRPQSEQLLFRNLRKDRTVRAHVSLRLTDAAGNSVLEPRRVRLELRQR